MLRAFDLLLTFSLISIAHAQFNFFDQMFGHHHQQHQQQHQPSGTSQWAAQSEHVQCSQYLCPATLVCVANPAECPCPDIQDVKCVIPDAIDDSAGTVVCVRGGNECAVVERLMRVRK